MQNKSKKIKYPEKLQMKQLLTFIGSGKRYNDVYPESRKTASLAWSAYFKLPVQGRQVVQEL